MGVLVVNPSIVPSEDTGSIQSWSSVATKIEAYAKVLYWTVISYARNWLGFTSVQSMIAPIQIDLLRIRIVVSPVSGLTYAVAT